MAYIIGIAEALGGGAIVYGWRACFRDNVTDGQLVEVVKRWLENHPETRDLAAVSLVAQPPVKSGYLPVAPDTRASGLARIGRLISLFLAHRRCRRDGWTRPSRMSL